jgi:hypothetical protein
MNIISSMNRRMINGYTLSSGIYAFRIPPANDNPAEFIVPREMLGKEMEALYWNCDH